MNSVTPFSPCHGWTGRRLGRLLTAVAASFLLLAVAAGEARGERSFDPRFSQNVQGDITIAANTVMTCPDSDSRCPAAQAGTGSALNNNQFRMRYVDIDDDPATFNSSTSELTLPTGAEVLFAGLYYGGRTSAGTGGSQAPNTSARGTVKLRVPGATGYQALTAAVDDSTEVSRAYGAFIDVTSIVQTAGVGNYTVADIQTGTGEDRYGGWSLVVAYRDSGAPARNLTIFDGLQNVTSAKPAITIGVTGFQTPATGPVKTNLGFVSFEGDRGIGGDSATLNGKVLSTATNPPNNFFNSSISRDGVPVTTKDPDYNNQLGYDAVLTKADGYLANGADSAAIRLQTSNETYLPQVITFATELFSPTVTAAKAVENITAPGQQPESGDVLRYTVSYTNTGGDGATQFTAEDAIPVGTTYVPGSLRITAGPNAPATPTDAIGDDLAEYLPAPQAVRFRLGQGANQTTGGLLTAADGPANSATITFEVAVDSGLTSGTRIVNEATGSFLSQTLGTEQSVESNEVVLGIQAPDLVMSKDHPDPPPGGPVTFNLGVANAGSAPSSGTVTVSDAFPASAFSGITITSSPGWNCSATVGLNLSCTRSDALPAGSDYPPIVIEAALVGSPPAEFSNTAEVTGGGDPNPTNNVATDYLPAPPATSDLAVTKTVDRSSAAAGSRVTWTITARNNGPSTATGVVVTDSLPAGANTDATAAAEQGTCAIVSGPEVQCSIGTLEAGQSVEVTISATVTASSGSITNGAEIEGDEPDPRPNNNESSTSFEGAGTADISVVKTAGPEPTAGEPFTYTITVTNAGPQAAPDLVVNDQIPALFTPTSVSAPGFSCGTLPPAGGTLECLFTGTLASGASATIELTGDLAPASAGVNLINTATGSSSLADPSPENDSSSVSIIPLPFADISMSKTASADVVSVNEEVTWTFGVQNLGPLNADPVVLEDELPAGLSVISLPAECELQGRSLTCNLGNLDPGSSREFRLTVRPEPSLSGETVTNSASISSPRPDPNAANNFDESSFEVRTAHELSVEKTGSGAGQVTSEPAGIDCGDDCTQLYDEDTIVTLTAEADPGSRFTGWSGEGCTGTQICEVTMNQAREVTANFVLVFELSVEKTGSGSGQVTSEPAGIDCGDDCTQLYDEDTIVTLTAEADPGSRFTGWGGSCQGVGTQPPSPAPWTCSLSMSESRFAIADFALGPPPRVNVNLKQTVNRKRARSGGKFTFKLNVRNRSDSSAINSTVCQKLPRGFKVVKAPGAKVGPGRKVCWQISRLDPGRSKKFSVVLRGFSNRSASFKAPATLTGENVTNQRREKTVRIVVPRKPRPVPPRPVTG